MVWDGRKMLGQNKPERQTQAFRLGAFNRVGAAPWGRSRAIAATLALMLGGCTVLSINPAGTDENSRTANQYLSQSVRGSTLESTTVPASLRLRNGWQMAPANTLHPNADLQAYHPGQNMFLVVLAEPTSSLPPGNIEEQSARYLDLMKRGFDQVLSNEQRTQVERISNFPAVQYELKGDVFTQAVAYLHTTIQMDERFYQVVVWTPDSMFVANAADMRAVVQEFGPAQR